MRDEPEVIVIHETLTQSTARDVFSYVVIVAVIGTGWFLGSSAMQWVGFLLLVLGAIGRWKGLNRRTPQQAADYLRDQFGVVAGPR